MEMEFPQRSDFNESDEVFETPSTPTPSEASEDSDSEYEPDQTEKPQATKTLPQQKSVIYDEITVEQPPPEWASSAAYGLSNQTPTGYIFLTTYGSLMDSEPLSYTDAMSRPDKSLWWKALCDEIEATIKNDTWMLKDLPLGKRAISLK